MKDQSAPHSSRRKSPEEIHAHVYRKDFVFDLKNHAWKPVAEHRAFAENLYEKKYLEKYGAPLDANMLELNLIFMTVLRNKWGRSIQPLGEMDDLAPVIGAIRLEGHQRESAALYLAQAVLDALKNDDRGFMVRVKKFSKATLGDHKNYQIWVAIGELLVRQEFAPSEYLSRALLNEGLAMKPLFFPTTQEVKEYAKARRKFGARGFGNLPADNDGPGWIRLWKSSGVDEFLTPLPVGRPKKAHTSVSEPKKKRANSS